MKNNIKLIISTILIIISFFIGYYYGKQEISTQQNNKISLK